MMILEFTGKVWAGRNWTDIVACVFTVVIDGVTATYVIEPGEAVYVTPVVI